MFRVRVSRRIDIYFRVERQPVERSVERVQRDSFKK